MPNCEENVKGIYQNATVTEAMMATTHNKDREIVIVKDFDASTVPELDDCSGNNYILAFEYCDPQTNVTTRRNFVSYEALSAIGDIECNGASIVNVDIHHEYNVISLAESFSLQDALIDLDEAISNVSAASFKYIKDGSVPASLLSSDGVNNAQVTGSGIHLTNLGDQSSIINSPTLNESYQVIGNGTSNTMKARFSLIGNGDSNTINSLDSVIPTFSVIGNGENNTIAGSDNTFIGNGSNNSTEKGHFVSIINGFNNKVIESERVTVMGTNSFNDNRHDSMFMGADTGEEFTNAQFSSMLMNGISTNNVDNFDLLTLKYPDTADTARDVGVISGNITVSGLYIEGSTVSTVVSNYIYSGIKLTNGSAIDMTITSLDEKSQSKSGPGVGIDINSIGFDFADPDLKFYVKSAVQGEAFWTGTISSNEQLKKA